MVNWELLGNPAEQRNEVAVMNEFACGDCWRRENLTFRELLDPAHIRRGQRQLCDEHRAKREELAA
ncbi:hypothetical protein GCM10009764_81220 [Nocardia ninae]|uniref:Uncharacterized protein n=2 Tax=Nocardia TaxID=1817 RepID=A0A511MJI6_9NOCA|nr:hypothetical protein NN4_52930 [Nocardia ninae NBRC 108245]